MQFQTTNSVINVHNLSYSYEQQKVLDNIDFEVQQNDFLTIIGPNGGGKSTLLKLILGIHDLQDGTINAFGKNYLTQIHRMGYVPQNTIMPLKVKTTIS